jgi:argininosuccinate synthase
MPGFMRDENWFRKRAQSGVNQLTIADFRAEMAGASAPRIALNFFTGSHARLTSIARRVCAKRAVEGSSSRRAR